MQQPEGPRYGGQPVSTQASEEDDGITPGQVPPDQRVNSEYLDNGILSDDFINEFDNLVNQDISEVSDSDHHNPIDNDYNYRSVENSGDFENFESNDHNKFIDDNYEGNDYDSDYYVLDDNNNQNRYDNNCREETHAPNHNQGYENYDSFYDQLNRSHTNAQLYDDHIKNQQKFSQNQINKNLDNQQNFSHKTQCRENFFNQHRSNNPHQFNNDFSYNVDDTRPFYQRQRFESSNFGGNFSRSQNHSKFRESFNTFDNCNGTQFRDSHHQPTMADIYKAVTDKDKKLDELSNRFDEFVNRQPPAAPLAPQAIQSFSDKFKNRPLDPESNLAKLMGVLPCVKTIVNLNPEAEPKHCIHYEISEEHSWLRLPKPNEYHPTSDGIPETIGSFSINMDFPGPSKGWWPTAESVLENPKEVKTPAQKFIKIPSKASEPQYEAFIQAEPLIFVDKTDSQKKKIKLQPEYFGQEQAIYWHGGSTIVSNLETKARCTLKALNQNSQILKESLARNKPFIGMVVPQLSQI